MTTLHLFFCSLWSSLLRGKKTAELCGAGGGGGQETEGGEEGGGGRHA